MNPFFLFFAGLVATACLLAWWRGGAPERIVAALFLVAWLGTLALDSSDSERFRGVETRVAIVDALLAVCLLAVAFRANRYWPMLAAALQLLIVLAHVLMAAGMKWLAVVYMVMTISWPLLQLLLLITGTLVYARRRRILGPIPGWSRS